MLTFHPVEIDRDLKREDLLYVGNFFPLKGMWWKKRKQRQGLILSIAIAWYRTIRENPLAPGFINAEMLITSLTRQVSDAKIILERFFNITRIGFNFNDGNKSPTLVSPKFLSKEMSDEIEQIINEVQFAPGLPPINKHLVTSEVKVKAHQQSAIIKKLKAQGREDLIPPVVWLYNQENPIIFYYERAGTLLARDKSVWPIRSIENWPGWLRTELFGTVVDIENAFCQFLVQKLELKYAKNKLQLELKYPDLLRADRDKKNFREELCRDILKAEVTFDNISKVKKLIMSLANGSNATPGLMTGSRSEAVKIVHQINPDLLPSDLIAIGNKLSSIAKQFKAAKRDLCIFLLGLKPTRDNQKKIFNMYFEWEREARYAIWNATGKTGLHLHDGIDGVISDMGEEELIEYIVQQTSVRVSVDKPVMNVHG